MKTANQMRFAGLNMDMLKRFLKDETGATAIEYGLIAGLIALAIIGAVGSIAAPATEPYSPIQDALSGAS